MKNLLYTIMFLTFFHPAFSQTKNTIVSLTGSIRNELTKEPLGVDIKLFNSEGKQISSSKSNSTDGYYFITGLRPDSTYYIRIMDLGYFSDSHEFIVPNTNKYQEYSKDFLVKPKKEGLVYPLKVSPFDLGKSKLRNGAELYLNDIINILKLNRRVEILIKVYPDNDSDLTTNKSLTEERARQIEQFLVTNGIDANRLKIEGNESTDKLKPPPVTKQAKGKRYIGPIYFQIVKV